jgi:hypothetical protein
LFKNHIGGEFIYWVFGFNSQIVNVVIFFPLVIGGIGVWGCYLLKKHYHDAADAPSFILIAAFCLSTVSSLTVIANLSEYYLGFWYVMCAIAGSGCDIRGALKRLSSLPGRAIITGLLFGLLLAPGLVQIIKYRKGDFYKDRMEIAQLLKYSSGDTCLAILPLHPIFCLDATRLYSRWQYAFFMDKFPQVKEDAERKNGCVRLLLSGLLTKKT